MKKTLCHLQFIKQDLIQSTGYDSYLEKMGGNHHCNWDIQDQSNNSWNLFSFHWYAFAIFKRRQDEILKLLLLFVLPWLRVTLIQVENCIFFVSLGFPVQIQNVGKINSNSPSKPLNVMLAVQWHNQHCQFLTEVK